MREVHTGAWVGLGPAPTAPAGIYPNDMLDRVSRKDASRRTVAPLPPLPCCNTKTVAQLTTRLNGHEQFCVDAWNQG